MHGDGDGDVTLLTADTRLKDRTVQYQVQSSSALSTD